MLSEEIKVINEIRKGMHDAFRALDINIVDCAASLRKLADAAEKAEKTNDDYWHPVFGPNGEDPRPKYSWVLVKIMNDPELLKRSDCRVLYGVPHIAELRTDGKWWPLEWDEPYGSKKVPFRVMYWRPIPGDMCTELEFGEAVTWRVNAYE